MAGVGGGGHLEEQEDVQLPCTLILLRPGDAAFPNAVPQGPEDKLSLFLPMPHPLMAP